MAHNETEETLSSGLRAGLPVFVVGFAVFVIGVIAVYAIEFAGLMPSQPGAKLAIELAPVFAFLIVMMNADGIMEAWK